MWITSLKSLKECNIASGSYFLINIRVLIEYDIFVYKIFIWHVITIMDKFNCEFVKWEVNPGNRSDLNDLDVVSVSWNRETICGMSFDTSFI